MYGDIFDTLAKKVAKRVTPVASASAAGAAVFGSLAMIVLFLAITRRKKGN